MAPTISLDEIDLLAVGNEIDIWGVVYSGKGKMFILPLPGENPVDVEGSVNILKMDESELERFFQQTDFLNVEGPNKGHPAEVAAGSRSSDFMEGVQARQLSLPILLHGEAAHRGSY